VVVVELAVDRLEAVERVDVRAVAHVLRERRRDRLLRARVPAEPDGGSPMDFDSTPGAAPRARTAWP